VNSPAVWLSQTFLADATENDLVTSPSLNTTRIAAVIAPVLGGILTAISEVSDTPPFNETDFQKVLVIAALAFVGVVVVADMFARAISTRSQLPVATPLPKAVRARWIRPGADLDGAVVAFRATNGESPQDTGEFLFVSDTGRSARWLPAATVELPA
jgi:hypothetical protein